MTPGGHSRPFTKTALPFTAPSVIAGQGPKLHSRSPFTDSSVSAGQPIHGSIHVPPRLSRGAGGVTDKQSERSTMSKRLIKRHTVEIPEAVWAYAVEVTGGQAQPQTFVRELLFEGMMAHRNRRTIVDVSSPLTGLAAAARTQDPGAVLTLQRNDVMCSYPNCGTLIEVGERALVRTGADGQKEFLHLDHVKRGVRSG